MGLDITAYSRLTPAPDAAREDGCVVDEFGHFDCHPGVLAWTEEHWPGHSGGIKAGAYTFAEQFGFRAGSYGGYNSWRDELSVVMLARPAKTVQMGMASPGPFVELIDFADNEGVIGPAVAAKLAKDFADHQAKAEIYDTASDNRWFLEQYNNWRKAFEFAADGGAVEFH